MKLVAEQLKLTLGQTEHLVFKQRIKNDNICELDFADDLKTSFPRRQNCLPGKTPV